jgi:hypothetical protein
MTAVALRSLILRRRLQLLSLRRLLLLPFALE